MKILNILFGNKIKAILSSVVLIAIIGQLSFLVYKYQRAIKDAVMIEKQRDVLVVENLDLVADNAYLMAKIDSLGNVIKYDSINYSKRQEEFQNLINQQKLLIKDKEKHISNLRKGLICKVPQKVKVGFLRYETKLVEVNCDSLAKTFD